MTGLINNTVVAEPHRHQPCLAGQITDLPGVVAFPQLRSEVERLLQSLADRGRERDWIIVAGSRADHLPEPGEYIYNVDNMAQYLGTFEQAVLLALVRPQTSLGKEAYGRAILKEVQHRLQRDVAAGAVYATLERLEVKGLISSRLAAGTAMRGGRPKRHYAIEPAGLRALNAARAESDRLWAGLRAPLKGMTPSQVSGS